MDKGLRTIVPKKQLPRPVLKGTGKYLSNVFVGHIVGPCACVCNVFGRAVRHVSSRSLLYTLSAILF